MTTSPARLPPPILLRNPASAIFYLKFLLTSAHGSELLKTGMSHHTWVSSEALWWELFIPKSESSFADHRGLRRPPGVACNSREKDMFMAIPKLQDAGLKGWLDIVGLCLLLSNGFQDSSQRKSKFSSASMIMKWRDFSWRNVVYFFWSCAFSWSPFSQLFVTSAWINATF